MVGSREAKEEVERLEIGENVDSDHPVVLWIKAREKGRIKEGRGERKEYRWIWSREAREKFAKQALGRVEMGERGRRKGGGK